VKLEKSQYTGILTLPDIGEDLFAVQLLVLGLDLHAVQEGLPLGNIPGPGTGGQQEQHPQGTPKQGKTTTGNHFFHQVRITFTKIVICF
jgi:hypothetical protein